MPPQGRGCGPDLNKSRVDSLNQIDATVAGLNRLARNLWWTWNQDAQDVFEELSPRAWRYLYHNAVAVLRELSDEEVADYVATGEPLDKAGGYGLQGGGEDFVVELVGSRDNVIGLPVTTMLELLATVGPADGAWRRLPGG